MCCIQVITKRVSFNEFLTPNGTIAVDGGDGNRTVPVHNRRNHISAIVETTEKSSTDDPPVIGGSSPKPNSSNSSDDCLSENDVFESEFLRILAKVHGALERQL